MVCLHALLGCNVIVQLKADFASRHLWILAAQLNSKRCLKQP